MARRGGPINKSSKSYEIRKGNARQALDEVAKNLEKVLGEILISSESGLDEIALSIHNLSQEYAPLDTGELRESSFIDKEKKGDKVTVTIGYTSDHAVYTHEIGPYKNPTTPGTGYKYLQRAVTEVESDIATILADAIKNEVLK